MAPLPRMWKDFFKDNPMNQTGIAWVSKAGNNWVYSRQIESRPVRFSVPDIKRLHKKVIGANYVWGIRDPNIARKIINPSGNDKTKVTVVLDRLTKTKFKANIKGSIKSDELRKILNKLRFYEKDTVKKEIKQVGSKTNMKFELKLNTDVLNSFEHKVKTLGWKIVK